MNLRVAATKKHHHHLQSVICQHAKRQTGCRIQSYSEIDESYAFAKDG